MIKKTGLTLTALMLTCTLAFANFSGGDDFDNGVIDAGKWSVFYDSMSGFTLEEQNGHLENFSPAAGTYEDRGFAYEWIANSGSSTQDWTITLDTVNLLDEQSMTNNENWFGLIITPDPSIFDNLVEIAIGRGNYGWPSYEVGSEGSTGGLVELNVDQPVSNAAVTLRMAYDAFTETIHTAYDEGGGFIDLMTYNVSDWDMGSGDELKLVIHGGNRGLVISNGQVYADNLTMVPSSEYDEPETLIGHPNFSGADNFKDGSINSAVWSNFHTGAESRSS